MQGHFILGIKGPGNFVRGHIVSGRAITSPLWRCLAVYTVKKKLRDSWICFYQTFLGLELGTLFPARESLVSDIPARDRNIANFLYSVRTI